MIAAAVIVIGAALAAYLLMSEPTENLNFKSGKAICYDPENPTYDVVPDLPSDAHHYRHAPANQSWALHVESIGSLPVEMYLATGYDRNWSFSQDIKIPPGVECVIYFPVTGGPVRFKTIKSAQGGEGPSGGEYAFATSSEFVYAPGTTMAITLYSRGGNTYGLQHIPIDWYREGD